MQRSKQRFWTCLRGLMIAAIFSGLPAAAFGAADPKMPSQVLSRLKSIEASLAKVEAGLEKLPEIGADTRLARAQADVKAAQETLDDVLRRYPQTPADHPAVRAARERIAAVDAKVKEAARKHAAAQAGGRQSKEASQALSDEWVAKLSPFAASNPGQPGYDRDKRFIGGATDDKEEMQRRLRLFAELSPLFGEYLKVQFAGGKSPELEQIEQTLSHELKTFEQSYKARIAERLAEADRTLDEALKFLRDQEAKIAGGGKPLRLQKDILPRCSADIDAVAAILPADDAKVAGLREKLAVAQTLSTKVSEAIVEQTFMTADRYAGADLAALKDKAGQIVAARHPQATALRITVISPDWKEQTLVEYTDTTRTALRVRTTRSVTAQVAAKSGGAMAMHTLDINKDRRADGSFGELYGHIMFTDAMLEKNVNAAAP